MRTFAAGEIERFLRAVDRELGQAWTLILIGGSAAALHHGVTRATLDIDTWTLVSAPLADAIAGARVATGLAIPVQHAAVADAPHEFEARLERALPGTRWLEVLVPERHDLALMKMVRGYAHDLETIAELHALQPLALDVLIDRYTREMGHVIGNPRHLRGNFLVLIERLYPDQLERVQAQLAPVPKGRRER